MWPLRLPCFNSSSSVFLLTSNVLTTRSQRPFGSKQQQHPWPIALRLVRSCSCWCTLCAPGPCVFRPRPSCFVLCCALSCTRIGFLTMRSWSRCSSPVCALCDACRARRAVSTASSVWALRRVVAPLGAHCVVRAVLWHVGSWGAVAHCAVR